MMVYVGKSKGDREMERVLSMMGSVKQGSKALDKGFFCSSFYNFGGREHGKEIRKYK